MGSSARQAALTVAAALALSAFAIGSRHVASLAEPSIDFDVGPSTGAYLDGFTESEERVPVTFRWTRERAALSLPLAGDGTDGTLALRLARFLDGNAQVRVFVNGRAAGSFSARSGRFRTIELPLRLENEPIELSLLVEDRARERLGVAIDWIRIDGVRLSLGASSFRPTLLVLGVLALALALGLTLGCSLIVASAIRLAGTFVTTDRRLLAWSSGDHPLSRHDART